MSEELTEEELTQIVAEMMRKYPSYTEDRARADALWIAQMDGDDALRRIVYGKAKEQAQ